MKAHTPEQKREAAEKNLASKRTVRRTSLGNRDVLSFKDLETGFHYRVVNDKDGRVQRAQEMGYEVVKSDGQLGDLSITNPQSLGSIVSKPVGEGVTGILMRIPDTEFAEIQAIKHKEHEDKLGQLQVDGNNKGLSGKIEIGSSTKF
jgi:hypothetical protein